MLWTFIAGFFGIFVGLTFGQKLVIESKYPWPVSQMNAETIASIPDLKLILVAATGVNVVDLEAAKARAIPVCNVAGYSTPSVAQHVAALLQKKYTNDLLKAGKVMNLAPFL